jgi:hypothetical protein
MRRRTLKHFRNVRKILFENWTNSVRHNATLLSLLFFTKSHITPIDNGAGVVRN